MSAFIVSQETMHACVLALAAGEDLTSLGRELFAMNEDAVSQRYNEGPDRTSSIGYVWESPGPLSPGAITEELACLRYQCAEGDVPERPLFERLSVLVDERRQDRVTREIIEMPTPPVVGAKYQAGLDVAEIAKLVRSDIKAAVASGELPKGLKCSVTIDRYSMGRSIDVRVTACPGPILEWLTETSFGHPVRGATRTANVRNWLDLILSLVRAYSRRDIDRQTDYYNVNFSEDVDLAWELERDAREALGPDPEAVQAAPVLRLLPAPVVEAEPSLVDWLELDQQPAPSAVVDELPSDDPWAAWIAREVR